MRFILRAVLPAVLTFFLVSYVTRTIWWQPSLAKYNVIDLKLSALLREQPLDLVFIGTSVVEHGIDPDLFDVEMARLGHRLRSYNLGTSGLAPVEMARMVERLLDAKPCCIKYVLLAPSFQHFDILNTFNTVRGIALFDMRNAIDFASILLSYPRVPASNDRWKLLLNIGNATFRHYSSVGIGASALGVIPFKGGRSSLPPHRRGYREYGSRQLSGLAADHFVAALPQITAAKQMSLEKHQQVEDVPTVFISSVILDYLISIGEEIERKGIAAFILLPPAVWFWNLQEELGAKFRARCGNARILDFIQPVRYGSLFRPGLYTDHAHLNTEGAELWSRFAAGAFSDYLDSEQSRNAPSKFCIDRAD